MKEKINIATILKDKPQGTKLYSRICGAVELKKVINVRKKKSIVVKELNSNNQHRFWHDGNFFRAGQCVLQPSENMADWSKFSWKKGDVLVSNDGKCKVIFERFDDDTYTSFVGKYYVECYGKNDELQDYEEEHYGDTVNYTKESEEAALAYINTIEKRLGGKLNHETLEIEKQTEFKDGDVVFVRLKRFCFIEIFNYFKGDYLYDHASLSTKTHTIDICGKYPIYKDEIVEIRIANDSEKKQLFEALSKENKVWNAEKKQVVDLKIKWITPKPFDRVITRNAYDDIWTANIFSHMNSCGEYVTIGCAGGYHYCLPYNDETAHLLGTTDEWKVGE